MTMLRSLCIGTLSAVLLTACGDSTGTDQVTLEDLVGTWNVIQLQWTRTDGTLETFDFIQVGGSITVAIGPSGAVTGSGTSFLTGDFTLSGTLMVQGESIILTLGAEASDPSAPTLTLPDTFSYTLTGNTLTLTNSSAMFDFGFDGIEEPASVQLILQMV